MFAIQRYFGKTVSIFCTILLLVACQEKVVEQKPTSVEINSTNTTSEKDNEAAVSEDFIISSAGIGKAKLGMTLGELKQIADKDTEFKTESSFLVDLTTVAVSKSGIVQYYILYPAGTTSHPDKTTPTDSDPITMLLTDNRSYQTEAGVKVGTKIEAAEAIYGDATLYYNTANESREYIKFGEENPRNIEFRPNVIDYGFAGIYPSPPQQYNETKEFQGNASIGAIEVSCPPADCPQPPT